MLSHFEFYLKQIDPEFLEKARHYFERHVPADEPEPKEPVSSPTSPRQNILPYSRIFNSFPFKVAVGKRTVFPYDARQITPIIRNLQDYFLNDSNEQTEGPVRADLNTFLLELHSNDPYFKAREATLISPNHKKRENSGAIQKNKNLNRVIDKLITIACIEILDDAGDIKEEISKKLHLTTQIANWKQDNKQKELDDLTKSLIFSFISEICYTQICIPDNLDKSHEYYTEFHSSIQAIANAKIDRKILIPVLLLTLSAALSSSKHPLANLLKHDQKQEIITAINNFYKKEKDDYLKDYLQTELNIIPEAIVKLIAADKFSGIKIVKTLWQNKEPTYKAALVEFFQKELKILTDNIAARLAGLSAQLFNAVLPGAIQEKLRLINLYGIPLAQDFDSTLLTTYQKKTSKTANIFVTNDQPVIFSTDAVAYPFDPMIIAHLTDCLPDLISKDTQKFASKLLLYAYGQLLNNRGEVAVPGLGTEPAPLIASFVRSILITLAFNCLSQPVYQGFFAGIEETLIDSITELEQAINKGLSIEFLIDIYSFPCFANAALAPKFTFPLEVKPTNGILRNMVEHITQMKLAQEKIANFLQQESKSYEAIIKLAITHRKTFNEQNPTFCIFADWSATQQAVEENYGIIEAASKLRNDHLAELKKIAAVLIPASFNALSAKDYETHLANIEYHIVQLNALILRPNAAAKSITIQTDIWRSNIPVLQQLKTFYDSLYKNSEVARMQLSKAAESEQLVQEYEPRVSIFLIIQQNLIWIFKSFPKDQSVADYIKHAKLELNTVKPVLVQRQQTMMEYFFQIKSSALNVLINSFANLQQEITALLANSNQQSSSLANTNTNLAKLAPLIDLKNKADIELKAILGNIKDIVEQTTLWDKKSRFLGGVKLGNSHLKLPNSIFTVRNALLPTESRQEEKAHTVLPADLQILKALAAFATVTSGKLTFFTRSRVTQNFRNILKELIKISNENLYDIVRLKTINSKLVNFKRDNGFEKPQARLQI